MRISFFQELKNSMASADSKRAYNHALFTRVAHEYDSATRLMSLWQDMSWKRALVDALPLLPNPACVDLACGTGDVTMLLGNKYPEGQIVGVDLTSSMLDVARRRCGSSHVTFAESDMCRTQFPNEWADIVTGSYAIRNAPALGAALAEVNRILKPGGIAAFLDFHKPANKFIAACNITLLRWWCGFCGVVIHGAPEHAYIAASLKKFPDTIQLRAILATYGFSICSSRTFMFGITELLILQKTSAAKGIA